MFRSRLLAGLGSVVLGLVLIAEPSAAGSADPITNLFKPSAKKKVQRTRRSDPLLDFLLGRPSRRSRDADALFDPNAGDNPDELAPQRRQKKRKKLASLPGVTKFEPGQKKPAVKKTARDAGDENDPELNPIVIVDNLVYLPDPRVHLGAELFTEPAPADPLANAIRSELLDLKSGLSSTVADRDAILNHYRTSGFKPVFATAAGLDERGRHVLETLAAAGDEGMNPNDYLPEILTSFTDDPAVLSGSPEKLARFDIELTARALEYARHASGGKLVPKRISIYFDIDPPTVEPAVAIKILAWSPFAAEYLRSLQPTHPAYAAFKKALVGIDRKSVV